MGICAEPQPGDLLLCYNPWLFRGLVDLTEEFALWRQGIRPPQGRPIYSHVALYLGGQQVVEAVSRGVIRSDSRKYLGQADVWTASIDSAVRAIIVGKAEDMLRRGYRYSWWDIVVQFFRLVFGARIPWHQTHSIICSVLVYDCWQAAGVKIAALRNCAPEDIAVYGRLRFVGQYGIPSERRGDQTAASQNLRDGSPPSA